MWNSPTSIEGKRFLLLSPSLKDRVGHYHDYAACVMEAARASGYAACLASHADYQDPDGRAVAVFRRTCGESQQGAAMRWFGPDAWLRRLPIPTPPLGGPDTGTGSAPNAPPPVVARSGKGRLAGAIGVWRHVANRLADRLAARDFAADLRRRLPQANALGDDDLVLLADAGLVEARGLAAILRRRPGGHWAVVLRREIAEHNGPDWSAQAWKAVLKDLAAAGGDRLRLYADTRPLAALYTGLAETSVDVLPIPVSANPRAAPTATFTAVYLGDARDEKGFPVLAQAILAMADERRTGKIRFVLQSHFNIAAGEPETARARQALAAAGPGVTLLDAPLDAAAYGQLIGQADAVLIPYDPEAYRFRSSGVLAEALAAGAPVLVTAGSWMAGQIQPHEQSHRAAGLGLRPLPVADGIIDLSTCEPAEGVLVELAFTAEPGRIVLTATLEGQTLEGQAGARVLRQIRDPEAAFFWSLRPAPGESRLRLDAGPAARIAAAWRTPPTWPTSRVGVIVGDGPDEIRDGLKELSRFRDHYRASAAAAAGDWNKAHSGRALVARLEADAKA